MFCAGIGQKTSIIASDMSVTFAVAFSQSLSVIFSTPCDNNRFSQFYTGTVSEYLSHHTTDFVLTRLMVIISRPGPVVYRGKL